MYLQLRVNVPDATTTYQKHLGAYVFVVLLINSL